MNNVFTDYISGSGQFSITASPASLIFDPRGDAYNPADLVFSDKLVSSDPNRYAIGANGNPAFEVAYTVAGNVPADIAPSFPVTFAVVPEPSVLSLLVIAFGSTAIRRFRTQAA